MAIERKNYPDIAPAGPTYSRAVKAGNLLFISGCTARGTGSQGKGLMERLRVTLERVTGIVKSEGGSPGAIVKITCFVTDIGEWRGNPTEQADLFARYFEGQYPANTLVEITALAEPGLDVEVEAIAVLE